MRTKKYFTTWTRSSIIASVLMSLLLISAYAYAEGNAINMIFDNAQIVSDNNISYFEFDVKAFQSDSSDVLGEGMIYVEYPIEIFSEFVSYYQKVSVIKTGILAGTDPYLNNELYRIVNITDTYSNVFAITFEAYYNRSDLKPVYSSLSSDASNPSDLFHISIEIDNSGSGTINYPAYIPGRNNLFYDYEGNLFPGGLNISAATLTVDTASNDNDTLIVDDPIINDDPFAGSVELLNFTTRIKKSLVELSWRVNGEKDLDSYIVKRHSDNSDNADPVELPVKAYNGKFNTYQFDDQSVEPEKNYVYELYAKDINGNEKLLSSTDVYLNASHKKTFLNDDTFTLENSYPNPFNPSFVVPFSVKTSQNVDIRLYDLNGKLIQIVADSYYSPGNYEIRVNGDQMPSGVYLLITRVNQQQAIQRMILMK